MEDTFIESSRLKLYPLHVELAEEFLDLALDTFDSLHPWLSFAEHPPTLDILTQEFRNYSDAFASNEGFYMGVYSKADRRFIGIVNCDDVRPPIDVYNGVRPWDVGYWLHKSYVGKGYAVEAVNCLINYVREKKSAKVFLIQTLFENEKSCKVAERLNFKLISTEELSLKNKRTDWPEKSLCKIFILELDN